MKLKSTLVLLASLAAGCASGTKGGGGEVDSVYPTSFHKPAQIDASQATNKDYVKSWTRTMGDGFDDFKKITIPAYTVEFMTSVNDVDQNKFAAAFDKSDGGKSILDMKVVLSADKHGAMMQEITDASFARFKNKMKAIGFEVTEWTAVKASSEDAVEFEKERMSLTPVENKGKSVSVAATGLGRLNSIFWAAGAASTARDANVVVVVPHFTVGFGYFGGDDKPQTVKANHGAANLKFTPQVQIYSGSGIRASGKYEMGAVSIDQTAVSDQVFVTELKKSSDSRADAKESEESTRMAAAAYYGTNANNVGVSSRAGVSYDLEIDAAKFKAEVLKQMELVENMLVEQYKAQL